MAGDQSLILMEKLLSKDEALRSWSKVTAGIWGINMQGKSNRRITGSRKHEGRTGITTHEYIYSYKKVQCCETVFDLLISCICEMFHIKQILI